LKESRSKRSLVVRGEPAAAIWGAFPFPRGARGCRRTGGVEGGGRPRVRLLERRTAGFRGGKEKT